jgi:hypothetical protein
MSGKNNPMFGHKHSEETRAKIAASLDHLLEVTDIKTGESKSYGSGKEAAVALSCSAVTVSRCLKNGKLYSPEGEENFIFHPLSHLWWRPETPCIL